MGFLSQLFGAKPPTRDVEYELEPREADDGGGFVVRRLPDGQRLRWQTLPKRDGIDSVKIVGVSHRLDALQDPSFAPGQPLALVPEPDNPHDPNGIAVWNASRTIHVGYLPREYSAKLAKGLGTGPKIGCMAIWETRKGKQRIALRALMVRQQAKVRGVRFE